MLSFSRAIVVSRASRVVANNLMILRLYSLRKDEDTQPLVPCRERMGHTPVRDAPLLFVAALARYFSRPGLADHRDANLPGIGHVGFDLARDLPRKHRGLLVGDLTGLDDHAHLAAGLDCEAFLDSAKRPGDLLQVLEPLHV